MPAPAVAHQFNQFFGEERRLAGEPVPHFAGRAVTTLDMWHHVWQFSIHVNMRGGRPGQGPFSSGYLTLQDHNGRKLVKKYTGLTRRDVDLELDRLKAIVRGMVERGIHEIPLPWTEGVPVGAGVAPVPIRGVRVTKEQARWMPLDQRRALKARWALHGIPPEKILLTESGKAALTLIRGSPNTPGETIVQMVSRTSWPGERISAELLTSLKRSGLIREVQRWTKGQLVGKGVVIVKVQYDDGWYYWVQYPESVQTPGPFDEQEVEELVQRRSGLPDAPSFGGQPQQSGGPAGMSRPGGRIYG